MLKNAQLWSYEVMKLWSYEARSASYGVMESKRSYGVMESKRSYGVMELGGEIKEMERNI